MNFQQHIVASGGRPPQAQNPNFLGMQWFHLLIDLPNAATTTIDLRDEDVIDTDQTIAARYNSLKTNPDLIVHIEQVQVRLFGGAAAALAVGEKAKLVEGAYLHVNQGGRNIAYSLGPHITEAYADPTVSFDSDDTAAAVIRGSLNGPPLILPQPLTLDLANDAFELRFSTATPASPGKAFFSFYGAVTQAKLGGAAIATKQGTIRCGDHGLIEDPEVMAAFDRATYANARALQAGRATK